MILVSSNSSRRHFFFFFLNDTAPTEIYTLSLHDALPIFEPFKDPGQVRPTPVEGGLEGTVIAERDLHVLTGPQQIILDRKSTRLNSSHMSISYAVFCLKKKKHFA